MRGGCRCCSPACFCIALCMQVRKELNDMAVVHDGRAFGVWSWVASLAVAVLLWQAAGMSRCPLQRRPRSRGKVGDKASRTWCGERGHRHSPLGNAPGKSGVDWCQTPTRRGGLGQHLGSRLGARSRVPGWTDLPWADAWGIAVLCFPFPFSFPVVGALGLVCRARHEGEARPDVPERGW